MEIRVAIDDDLEKIIELFRISLGDEGGVPSTEFWKWKHEQNPFGKSPTLLAFQENKLIGLRTFLQWRFQYRGKKICAYRAVDTATHPDYRGQGIFSKLTLSLIDHIKQGGLSLIFNTPNKMSMPGYLKMGWKVFGKTPLLVKPLPVQFILNRFIPSDLLNSSQRATGFEETFLSIEPFLFKIFENVIVTDWSLDYLKWRYAEIPELQYNWHSIGQDKDCVIVFYRIKSGKIKELRITDIFFSKLSTQNVKKALSEIVDLTKPDAITILNDASHIIKSVLPSGFMFLKYFGLTITYRGVNSDDLIRLASYPELWYFSAGSIELL